MTTQWHSEREPQRHPPKFAAQILKGRQPSLRDDREEFRKNIPVNFQDGNRYPHSILTSTTAPSPSLLHSHHYRRRHYYEDGSYYQNVGFPDGSAYEGDFNAQSRFHGRGMFVWKNGDRSPTDTYLTPD